MKTIVTAGGSSPGSSDYVAAAATPDGVLAVAYVPPSHTGPLSVDMSVMKGPARARWFDPTAGVFINIASALTGQGSRSFMSPGTNAAGATDWVLMLDRLHDPGMK
jgi:hypothetical protein